MIKTGTIPGATSEVYYDALRDERVEHLEAACRTARDTLRFFPKVVELKEFLRSERHLAAEAEEQAARRRQLEIQTLKPSKSLDEALELWNQDPDAFDVWYREETGKDESPARDWHARR